MAKIQWELKVMEEESMKRMSEMSEIDGRRNRPRWPTFSRNKSYGERISEKNVRNRR